MDYFKTGTIERWAPWIVLTISTVIYSNTLGAGLVYDDNSAIIKNLDLRPETTWTELLKHDFWGVSLQHQGSHKSYRPLTVASFRLNYALHQLEPFGYHLVNVILHSVCSLLVYYLTDTLYEHKPIMSLLSALLFAVHPVHVEAVAGVVGRAELLATGCSLIILIIYMRRRLHEQSCQSNSVTIAGFALAGLLCKEQAIMALPICAAFELLIVNRVHWKQIRVIFTQTAYLRMWQHLCALISGTFILFIGRLWIIDFCPPTFSASDNPAAAHPSLFTRLLTYLYLPILNLQLLVHPHTLCFDWSMDSIPLVHDFCDGRLLSALALYAVLGVLVGKTYSEYQDAVTNRDVNSPLPSPASRSPSPEYDFNANFIVKERKKSPKRQTENQIRTIEISNQIQTELFLQQRTFLSGAIILVLAFLPSSNLLATVGFVVAERVLYLPSVGYCICLVTVIDYIRQNYCTNQYKQVMFQILTLCLLAVGTSRTWTRNQDWQSEESLYKSGFELNPAKAYSNYGNLLSVKGKQEEAQSAYLKALAHRPNMADTLYNLGITYQEQGDLASAVTHYEAAIRSRQHLAVAYLNLGLCYWKMNQIDRASQIFTSCAALNGRDTKDPHSHQAAQVSCLYNQGRLMAERHKHEEAIRLYETAEHRLTPHFSARASLFNMLGESLAKTGRLAAAESRYRQSLHIKPDHVPAHLTMAYLRLKQGETAEADDWFKRALQLSTDSSTLFHYCQFHQQINQPTQALDNCKQSLALNPSHFDTLMSLGHLERTLNNNHQSELYFKMAVENSAAGNSNSLQARANYGAILHVNGKYKQAQEQYEEVLRVNPSDKITSQNLEKLKRMDV